MQVYFSHSYRDVAINSHFLEFFLDEEIPLQADQKTEVWCVAKLERYLNELNGFVSIIPRRPTDVDAGAYSSYIGQELNLARRARLPRLLFIDHEVFQRHRLDFPEDAVPFHPDALQDGNTRHGDAIRDFRRALEGSYRQPRSVKSKDATVVVGEGAGLHGTAQDIAEILQREDFSVTLLSGRRPGRGLEDIRLLETLWRAELCVFLLGSRLSEAHIALAVAHSHCIPSIRLQYDGRASDCNPGLSGLIRWRLRDDMLVEFTRQLTSYKVGLVRPVDMARSTTPTTAARTIGTMQWRARAENYWDVQDGRALLAHVHPDQRLVRDDVDRVRGQLQAALGRIAGREGGLEVCGLLYDGLRRYNLAYELEPPIDAPGKQKIRTPGQIESHKCATCLDCACLFAALLEAAYQNPLLVVLETARGAHAIVGYRVRGEPAFDLGGLGDLRAALARRDAVLFEPTGALQADEPVGAEAAQERRQKFLSFSDAVAAAERMLASGDTRLIHYVDVRTLRVQGSNNP